MFMKETKELSFDINDRSKKITLFVGEDFTIRFESIEELEQFSKNIERIAKEIRNHWL
jgi:hypothetical protein